MYQKMQAAQAGKKKKPGSSGCTAIDHDSKKVKKKQKKSAKISYARTNVAMQFNKSCSQLLSEGHLPEDLAARVVLKAGKKREQKSGKAHSKIYTPAGKVCIKAVSLKIKAALKEKKTAEEEEKEAKKKQPLLHKAVKICKDSAHV